MAEDVEKYLLDRFQNKLKNSSKGWFHDRFVRLSDLIQEILNHQSPRDISLKHELILLDNALEECQTLSLKRAVVSPNKAISQRTSLANIRQKLEKLKTDLDALVRDTCPWEREDRPGLSRAITTPRVDPSMVHGLEDEVDSLERLLLNPERAESDSFKAIGIVGMRGVGKTTLAQVVFHRSEVKDRYLPRIWVCLSPSPQLDRADPDWKVADVTERILKQLGVGEETGRSIYSKRGLSGLLYTLHLQLAGNECN